MKSAAEVLADYDALYKVPNEERWIIDGDEAQVAADLAAVVRDLQAQVSASYAPELEIEAEEKSV